MACVLASAGCSSPGTEPAAIVIDVGVDAEASPIARGAEFVRNRACADCHQSAEPAEGVLSGRATPLPFTKTYPANLTPDPETGLGRWLDAEIGKAIRAGYDQSNHALCDQMPRFYRMSDDELAAIIVYLRSLPPLRRAIPASVCPPIKVEDAGTRD